MMKSNLLKLYATWRAHWFAEADAIGIVKAKAEALESLLISRLGEIPASFREQIYEAELASLGNWFDRALQAHFVPRLQQLASGTGLRVSLPEDSLAIKSNLGTMRERWKAQWFAEAEAIGVVKGKTEGKMEAKVEALEALLISRFGMVPASFLKQIDEAELASLDSWFARAFDADDLPSVFDQG
jgi:hypothetical protein